MKPSRDIFILSAGGAKAHLVGSPVVSQGLPLRENQRQRAVATRSSVLPSNRQKGIGSRGTNKWKRISQTILTSTNHLRLALPEALAEALPEDFPTLPDAIPEDPQGTSALLPISLLFRRFLLDLGISIRRVLTAFGRIARSGWSALQGLLAARKVVLEDGQPAQTVQHLTQIA